jgi:hypothetical protein
MVSTQKSNSYPTMMPGCLFEHAEHWLETLFLKKELSDQSHLEAEIVLEQQDAACISLATLNRAISGKVFQQRVRPAMILQNDLLQAIQNISVKVKKAG